MKNGAGSREGALRTEVEHVLASTLESKSNQAAILSYLTSCYLRGEESAKEYAIAVDALKRGEDFDPKKDAIVRVEILKLRRSLKDFYAGPGRGRDLQVGIATGKYSIEIVETTPPLPEASRAGSGRHRRVAVALAILALLVVAAVVGIWKYSKRQPPQASTIAATASTPAGSSVRILCGSTGGRLQDSSGLVWESDHHYSGGRAISSNAQRIRNTQDQILFQTQRQGDFSYAIPLPPGDYEVRLHFAETVHGPENGGGGEASRVFAVHINGVSVLPALDVLLDAGGPNLATTRVFPGQRPGKDGTLHIRFESLRNDKAFVNALEVLPGYPDRMLPLRIAAGAPSAMIGARGETWLSDRYFLGGRVQDRTRPVATESPQLFRFERFGRFEYCLPALKGHSFLLRLWMAEQYFGVLVPGSSSRNPRLFDILANGERLLHDFSLIDAAGGPLKVHELSFPHLVPDGQGKVRVMLAPSSNYAVLNALELLDEGPAK